ncbi:hypothetical protein K7432_014219 [Basidiobolus ranarum]|uniref:Uncharacterized protein n=1 Tax=Basidiobolus ranarum TaxID=34480 RepID=A0ABR2WI37_9FUNG
MKETEFYQPKAITYLTFDCAETHATQFGDCGLTKDTVLELNYFLDEFLSQLVRTAGYELVDIDQLCTSISFQFAFNSLGSRCVEEGKKVMKTNNSTKQTNKSDSIPLRLPGQDKWILEVLRGVCANESLEIPSIESFCLTESVKSFLKAVIVTLGQYIVHSMVLMAGKSNGEMLSIEDLFTTMCQDDQLNGMFVRMRIKKRMEEQIAKQKLSSGQEKLGRLRSSSAPSKTGSKFEKLTTDMSDSAKTIDTKNKGLGKILRSLRDNVHISNHSSEHQQCGVKSVEPFQEVPAKNMKQTTQLRHQKMVDFDLLLDSDHTIKLTLTPARLESMEVSNIEKRSVSTSIVN